MNTADTKDHKDFSTAILDKKKAPNRLMVNPHQHQKTIKPCFFLNLQVEDAINDDNSAIQLSQAKLTELKIFKGEPVFLKGKKRHETLCIALVDPKLEDSKIRLNKVIRKNLRVRLGGTTRLN